MMMRFLVIFNLMIMMAWPSGAAESFNFRDTAGKAHILEDYRGKWVVINFWATWCPPCLEEIPDLIALHEKRKDLAVIGIAMDYKNKREIMDFADDNLMTYPIVLGDEKVMQRFGPMEVLPTTYIYDPQGKLAKTRRGLVTREYIEKVIAGK